MAYFERVGPASYVATRHTGGAWDPTTQHVGPALGLLAHAVEADRDLRRDDGLVIGRLSYDILGTMPVDPGQPVEAAVRVLRPGRTIELVEAALSHDGRDAVRLRAWLMRAADTTTLAGSSFEPMPPPDELPSWDPTTVWPGGFIASAEVRRRQEHPGRGRFWVRTAVPLLDDETVSDLARAAGLLDIANGMTVRVDPATAAFPNIDLTAHLFRAPSGDWTGFDTTVSLGPDAIGLTSSVLHDVQGPIGTLAQILTVRPT
jgi:hypothetical protein